MIFDQINLTTQERIDHRIRFLLYGGMAVLVIIISLVNLTKGYRRYSERTVYQDKLAELHQQIGRRPNDETGRSTIDPKAYQKMMNRGMRINRQIALDLFPWVKILDALEKALPEVVIIDSFRPADGFTRILLSGRTDSLEKLVDFQKGLEDADLFAAVVMENMGIGDSKVDGAKPDDKSRMAFQLHCRLRLDQVLPEEPHGSLWRALKNVPK